MNGALLTDSSFTHSTFLKTQLNNAVFNSSLLNYTNFTNASVNASSWNYANVHAALGYNFDNFSGVRKTDLILRKAETFSFIIPS